ncbi:MAG: NAD(P)H-dependent oxidoreductase [Pseudomonadota bacterium]
MKILHIDSSALGDASVSRKLTAATVAHLREKHADASVVYRDLAAEALPHVTGPLLQIVRGPADANQTVSPELTQQAALSETLLLELLAADVLVVGAPMYNFSVPSSLKAWIDRVLVAGRTFSYTASGPKGLVVGKRVIIASARGSAMSGTPYETAMDHQEAYLKAVFNFIGVTDLTIVRAEGLAMGEAARQAAIDGALSQVASL